MWKLKQRIEGQRQIGRVVSFLIVHAVQEIHVVQSGESGDPSERDVLADFLQTIVAALTLTSVEGSPALVLPGPSIPAGDIDRAMLEAIQLELRHVIWVKGREAVLAGGALE